MNSSSSSSNINECGVKNSLWYVDSQTQECSLIMLIKHLKVFFFEFACSSNFSAMTDVRLHFLKVMGISVRVCVSLMQEVEKGKKKDKSKPKKAKVGAEEISNFLSCVISFLHFNFSFPSTR